MLKYFAVILSFLLFSCSYKPKERRVAFDEVVDYREVLFEVEDSLELVAIDFGYSARDVANQVEKVVGGSICEKDFYFKVQDNKSIEHKVCVHKECKVRKYPFCGIRMKIDIAISRRGDYLFERMVLDSVNDMDSLVFNEIFNPMNYPMSNNFVEVDWYSFGLNDSIPIEAFYNALNEIENGYLLVYDSLSRQYFNKQLSNLDRNELDSLKHILPFKIQIGATHVPPPPPPPLKK